jgi:uncharacterized membrane protein YjgN (DUF898 family)
LLRRVEGLVVVLLFSFLAATGSKHKAAVSMLKNLKYDHKHRKSTLAKNK